MASRLGATLVFILPAVASVALGGVVMAQILQEPGRGGTDASEHVTIVGLEASYAAPAAVSAHVHVTHEAFDCGDLDIRVSDRQTGRIVGNSGFFGQCFASTNTMIPVDGAFSINVVESGTYEMTVTIRDAQGRNSASTTGVFTVS